MKPGKIIFFKVWLLILNFDQPTHCRAAIITKNLKKIYKCMGIIFYNSLTFEPLCLFFPFLEITMPLLCLPSFEPFLFFHCDQPLPSLKGTTVPLSLNPATLKWFSSSIYHFHEYCLFEALSKSFFYRNIYFKSFPVKSSFGFRYSQIMFT